MPDEFTPEEKKMLADSPADSATFIGDDDATTGTAGATQNRDQQADTGVPREDLEDGVPPDTRD